VCVCLFVFVLAATAAKCEHGEKIYFFLYALTGTHGVIFFSPIYNVCVSINFFRMDLLSDHH